MNETKAVFIELGALWKSKGEGNSIASGPLTPEMLLAMHLPISTDARILIQHNEKKGENQRAPDFRATLILQKVVEVKESNGNNDTNDKKEDFEKVPF